MITTRLDLTAAQEESYNELFARMAEYSGKSVTTLHEYLAALDSLMKEMSTKLNANTYNLLRLPLTEPVFEINPDTRDIIVPKAFKDNGLTVQGDKLAEIVWFKMPRFFDLTDFYNFKNDGTKTNSDFEDYHTYIEWYNPSAKLDEHMKGVDLAYAMTCDEDYIYFGWPLADKVSGEAGTIQFTVRFLGVSNGEIKFNFSTRIQSCVIKTTLNFDLLNGHYRADSWEDLIYSRPVYSGVVNSIDSPAPIILEGLIDSYQDLEAHVIHHAAEGNFGDDDYQEAYDETVYELPLTVKAAAPNAVSVGSTQELVFVWYHQVGDMNGLGMVPDSVQETAIVTSPLASEDYTVAAQSTYTVSQVGRYTVQIGNTLSSASDTTDKKTRYVYTGVVEVPAPSEVLVRALDGQQYGYTGNVWHSQADNTPFRTAITLAVQVPSHYTYDGDGQIISILIPGDELHYQWFVKTPSVDQDGIVTYSELTPVEGATNATYKPNIEGIYTVKVWSSRNGASLSPTMADSSDIRTPPYRFTEHNAVITATYDETAHILTAELEAPERNPAHKLSYTWYRTDLDDNSGTQHVIEQGGRNGVPLNNAKLEITRSGNYYVSVAEVVFDGVPGYESETLANYRIASNANGYVVINEDLTLNQGQQDENNNG